MKLALLGHHIAHSLSPRLYKELLGDKLESYELLDIPAVSKIPSLEELALRYDGINITSPYKELFFKHVKLESESLKSLGAINTISFTGKFWGTNTDFLAVKNSLESFKSQYSKLFLIILGNGVMSRMTCQIAQEFNIPFIVKARSKGIDLEHINLSQFHTQDTQTIVINSCARQYVFSGKIHPDFIFWDYNYNVLPHLIRLPSLVKSYIDGRTMLRDQALAAIEFWQRTNPKLKC